MNLILEVVLNIVVLFLNRKLNERKIKVKVIFFLKKKGKKEDIVDLFFIVCIFI